MKSLFLFICFLFTSDFHQSYPQIFSQEPIVRVRIIYTLDSLNVSLNNNWELSDSSSSTKIILFANDTLLCTVENDQVRIKNSSRSLDELFSRIDLNCNTKNGTLKIRNVPYGIGWWWQGSEDRTYEGKIEISVNEYNKFDVIVVLPLRKIFMRSCSL